MMQTWRIIPGVVRSCAACAAVPFGIGWALAANCCYSLLRAICLENLSSGAEVEGSIWPAGLDKPVMPPPQTWIAP